VSSRKAAETGDVSLKKLREELKVSGKIFDRIFDSLTAWASELPILQLGDGCIGRN